MLMGLYCSEMNWELNWIQRSKYSLNDGWFKQQMLPLSLSCSNLKFLSRWSPTTLRVWDNKFLMCQTQLEKVVIASFFHMKLQSESTQSTLLSCLRKPSLKQRMYTITNRLTKTRGSWLKNKVPKEMSWTCFVLQRCRLLSTITLIYLFVWLRRVKLLDFWQSRDQCKLFWPALLNSKLWDKWTRVEALLATKCRRIFASTKIS